MDIELSNLGHSWFIDIDGTIFKHNSHLDETNDLLLDSVIEFFQSIPKDDLVVLITARKEEHRERTVESLKKYNIKYDEIIFDAPTGERILINDKKPSGLITAKSINIKRDEGLKNLNIKISNDL